MSDRVGRSTPEKEKTAGASPRTAEEIADWLVSHLAELLELNPDAIDVQEPLSNYWLGSLQGIGLVGDLEQWLDLPLSQTILYEHPNIMALAANLERHNNLLRKNGHAGADLRSPSGPRASGGRNPKDDTVLDASIFSELASVGPVTEPQAVLLTGATGFLGAFLLYELLQQTKTKIYCLVRCLDIEEGRSRVVENLNAFSLWHETFMDRIVIVSGDLSQPLLGLPQQEFLSLAGEVDAIYHCGALVNYLYPYAALWNVNVLGTHEVLRLANCVKMKAVHFISTLGVLYSVAPSEAPVKLEEDSLDSHEGLYLGFGYAQSKWVAEELITMGRKHGLTVCVYRPAMITGHSGSGICNTDDFLCRLIKGCIQLGSIPELDIELDMVPVDYVSRAIVHLSKQGASPGKTFHLTNPRPLHWREMAAWIRSLGYPLRQISYEEWQRELIDSARASKGNTLEPLLPFFTEKVTARQMFIPEMYAQVKLPQFDCHNTLEGLRGTPIACPAIDAKFLNTYFSYFVRSDFLSLAGAGGGAHTAAPASFGAAKLQ
jgi:thioester reductase-like protein